MAIDPNDYGAAAGYVTNDQGNYVMPDYSFSSNVTPVNAPTDWTNYSVPDATFDASSFSPADYSSSQFSDFAVSAPETNWWDQAGQNLGSWWDQTTQDAGNWLGDNNINLTSGSGINPDTGYIAPVENFSDIKWEAYTPDPVYVPSVLTSNVVEPGWDWGNLSTWNPDNAGHSMDDVARDVINSSQFKYWMGPSTDAEWKAQDRALDQYQRDNKVDLGLGSPTTKSIWFESTGDGNFTTPWGNPTGEDRKIKPLESPTDWQASAIVTKPLGAPVEQYSVEGVFPMIPIADIKYSNSDVSWSAPAVVAALGNVKVGDVVDGRTITGLNFDDKGSLLSVTSKSKAGYEETNTVKDSPFFVKVQETNNASRGNLEMGDSIKDPFGGSAWKVVGDTRDSTNSIISVTVVSAIDGHKEILTSGYVFNKAKELDGKASTNTSVTHPDSKPVDPVAPVVPVTPDTAGVGAGVIIGTGTAVGYVAPVAPVTSTTLVVPGSDYLKTVYPNWETEELELLEI
jgi:hypothetical protein